jgi:hypothetical protein
MALAADMQSKLGQIMAIEVARVQRAAGVADQANELQVKLQPATDGDLISLAIVPNASAEATTLPAVSSVPAAQVATLQGSLTQLRLISDVLVGRVQMGDALDRLTPSLAQLAHPPSSSSSGVVSPVETAANSASNTHSHTETAELEQQVSLVSQMRALHARQQSALTASNTSASSDAGAPSNTSGGAAGLAFPYNIPASSAAKKPATTAEELFEAPKPSRDRVSELFALDDDDPIISPAYKANNKTATTAAPSPSPTAAAANKMADPLLSPNAKRPAITSSTSTAVASTPSTAGAAGATAAASLTSPVTPATAAAAAAPSPSAAASSLLSTLLSAPGSGQQLRRASKSLFSSSGGSGASSAFGGDDELAAKGLSAFESPIGSPAGMGLFAPVPPPAGLSDGGLFGSDGPLVGLGASSSRTGRVRQGAVSASGRGGAGGLGFGLEDDDDMILLPSAAAFRDKPKPTATTTTSATKAATTATAATAAALSAAAPAPTSAKPAAAAPKAATSASSAAAPAATAAKPKPVAKARDLFDADDDPLSWMGTGKK